MADDEVEQFEGVVDAGASKTFPMQCSALRKNGHVLIKGRPCKIVEMSTSKTGKHGHAKVNMTGIDIFTGKKLEDMCPSTHNMEVPVVKRADYDLVNIEADGFVHLMLDDGSMKEDLKLPETADKADLVKDIKAKFDAGDNVMLTVLTAMGEECIVAVKQVTKDK